MTSFNICDHHISLSAMGLDQMPADAMYHKDEQPCPCGYITECGIHCGDGSICHLAQSQPDTNVYHDRSPGPVSTPRRPPAERCVICDKVLRNQGYVAFHDDHFYTPCCASCAGDNRIKDLMYDGRIVYPLKDSAIAIVKDYWTARVKYFASDNDDEARERLTHMVACVTDTYPDLDQVAAQPWTSKKIKKPKARLTPRGREQLTHRLVAAEFFAAVTYVTLAVVLGPGAWALFVMGSIIMVLAIAIGRVKDGR